MPNKTIYLTKENLDRANASGEGVGPFINRLIEESESHENYSFTKNPKTVKEATTPEVMDVVEDLKKLDPTLTTANYVERKPLWKEKKKRK